MVCRSKLRLELVTSSLIVFLLILGCSLNALTVFSQETVIARGSNFKLLFNVGESIAFQHVAKVGVLPESFTAQVNIASGVLNGTLGELQMFYTRGELTFRAWNTCRVSSQHCAVYVNGELTETGEFEGGDIVRIIWSPPEGWNPVLAIMGLTGLAILMIAPTFSIYQVKVKKEYRWVFWGIILFALGYGLLMGWLQS